MSARGSHANEIVVTSDGSPTLHSGRFGETYHSLRGALAEARHVFLKASGVFERVEAGLSTRVLEIGFGTGLNYLVTARAAETSRASLYYEALEAHPLPSTLIRDLRLGELLGTEALASDVSDAFLRFETSSVRTGPIEVDRRGFSRLLIRVENAASAHIDEAAFDAVYLDAFSPKNNPDLWTPELLMTLARALHPGGRLVTYCVAGEVRRRLAAAGLQVEKRPGPVGGKREMTLATRPPD